MCGLLGAIRWNIEGKNPAAVLAFDLEQFAARGQEMDMLCSLVQLLGNQCDRLDHVLTAVENDQKLLRTNEVDQLQTGIFRFECKSQRCRDGPRYMPRIGQAFQVDKMHLAVKLLGNRAADSQRNGRFADAAWAEQCYEPCFPQLVADLTDGYCAPDHRDRPQGEPALLPEPGVPAFRPIGVRGNVTDERVAPSLDVCDVSGAKLAVTERLADRGDVDPDASLLDVHVRPDVIDQFLLCDHFPRTPGQVDQNVKGPAAKGQHLTLAPKHPFPARKLKGAKLQISLSFIVNHGS
ncbi:hypothetical protein ACVWW1_000041 [Bradyrhizobium sp. JR3.5]